MEAFLGLVILIFMGWGAIKLLIIIGPKILFMIVFLAATFALVSWVVFLEASGLSIIIGIFGAIAAAWAFAKAKT